MFKAVSDVVKITNYLRSYPHMYYTDTNSK